MSENKIDDNICKTFYRPEFGWVPVTQRVEWPREEAAYEIQMYAQVGSDLSLWALDMDYRITSIVEKPGFVTMHIFGDEDEPLATIKAHQGPGKFSPTAMLIKGLTQVRDAYYNAMHDAGLDLDIDAYFDEHEEDEWYDDDWNEAEENDHNGNTWDDEED